MPGMSSLARFWPVMFICSVLLVVSGCATQRYDDVSDKELTEQHKKIETKIFQLQSADRAVRAQPNNAEQRKVLSFAANQQFYAEVLGSLTVTSVRLQSFAEVETTRRQIAARFDALIEDVGRFEDVHRRNDRLTEGELVAFRGQIASHFRELQTIAALGRPEKKG